MTFERKPVEVVGECVSLSGLGEIVSHTTVYDPPEGHEANAPYVLALIKLDEGPVVTAQLTDLDSEPAIGDRVEMVTRRLTTEGTRGMIVYGYKFRRLLRG